MLKKNTNTSTTIKMLTIVTARVVFLIVFAYCVLASIYRMMSPLTIFDALSTFPLGAE